ncbi:aldo/keto reductase [Streptomyces sp. BE20]|uniref:aldo/keto reductase n=1 Tax=Streptomyces sp. BE20 TaxID=3002525 RepID=UPI002E78CBD4|nr:aldo/keto reductase [Streptomyces sp. BE20]MEE1820974.1 aldo/keto reductase [Streptomyces sp. BE20]
MGRLDSVPRHLAPGLAIHPLGVGCRSIGALPVSRPVPDSEWLDGMRSAVERGADFFDVADTYGASEGHAERLIGQVVRECRRQGITLKVSSRAGHKGSAPHPYAGPHLRHQLEQSLENLCVEQVDLFGLPSHDFGPSDCYLGPAIEVLRTMKDLGMIGAIGLVGPHGNPATAPDAVGHKRFDQLFTLIRPDVVLLPFNALTPLAALPDTGESDLLSRAAGQGAGVLLTSPLAGGLLAGTSRRAQGRSTRENGTRAVVARALEPLRRHLGGHPAVLGQAALRYCLSRGPHTAVVAGFGRAEHVALNYASLDLELSPQDEAAIEAAYTSLREALRPRTARLLRQDRAIR